MKDLRYHVMRMQSKRIVNPLDSQEFTRPIKLHRRDPRAPLQGAKEEAAANAVAAAHKAAEEEEKAKNQAEQDKKDADKAAALEKIAPYGGAQKQKKNAFQKKTQQVYKSNDAEKKLRYEEFFPWFIEDFDNKNTWVGQLESSLSKGVFAMFVLDDGAFKMVPIEKWYKFTEKNKFKTMTSEEAEVVMKQNAKPPRWLMNRTEEKERERRTLEENARATKKLFTRKGDRLPKAETDADDLDFDDDQFADDEEAPIMEGEEHENKEIEVISVMRSLLYLKYSCSKRLLPYRIVSKRNNCLRTSLTPVANVNTRKKKRRRKSLRPSVVSMVKRSKRPS